MAQTIWKFPIPQTDLFSLDMPAEAQVLCVQIQHGDPQLWAMVNETEIRNTRQFRLAGTGHQIPTGLIYIGTFQLFDGAFVGHLFEIPHLA